MNIRTTAWTALLVLAACAAWPTAHAQSAKPAAEAKGPPPPPVPGTEYTPKGADTCLDCHDESSDSPGFSTAAIFKTRHAQRRNAHAPFGPGGLQCEACHGPGKNHSHKDAKAKPTINSQKRDSFMSAAERNEPCLTCHQDTTRNAWHVGAHDRNQLACADCHKLHTKTDPVLAKATEPQVCTGCHKQQRLDFLKASSHPLKTGRMACSDCHASHGSTATAMLVKPSLNQTCYSCHAEKRGPLLWEHAPVAEDCSLCHTSHGSVRPALLTQSAPLLCQQCHSAAGHPSVARTGAALPGGSGGAGGAIFISAGSCTNCHTQTHGSNHPAGAKLMR